MIQIDDPFPGSPASFLNSFPAGCITKYSPLFHQGFFYLSEFKKGDHAEQIQFLRQAMSHPHPAFPSQSPSPGKGIIHNVNRRDSIQLHAPGRQGNKASAPRTHPFTFTANSLKTEKTGLLLSISEILQPSIPSSSTIFIYIKKQIKK